MTDIETIFDYDLSERESKLLTAGLSKSKYLSVMSPDGIIFGLASLFDSRGDKEKRDYYLSKLDADFVKTHVNWDLVRPTIS